MAIYIFLVLPMVIPANTIVLFNQIILIYVIYHPRLVKEPNWMFDQHLVKNVVRVYSRISRMFFLPPGCLNWVKMRRLNALLKVILFRVIDGFVRMNSAIFSHYNQKQF